MTSAQSGVNAGSSKAPSVWLWMTQIRRISGSAGGASTPLFVVANGPAGGSAQNLGRAVYTITRVFE